MGTSSIDQHFVNQYSANIFHLSQQKGSKLAGLVRNESQKAESAFYDRLGQSEALTKTTRHGDTPLIEVEHSRRRVTMVDKEWATLLDDQDKIRMLNDPTSEYAQNAMWSLGRAKDREIIDQALGTAYSGKAGATSVVMPNSQKLASVASSAGSGVNVQALRRIKKKFADNNVDEGMGLNAVLDPKAIYDDLLAETEISSADFNTVKALAAGEIDTFMGFKFTSIAGLLNVQSGALAFNQTTGAVGSGSGDADTYRRGIFFQREGLLLATGMEVKGRISERDDKSYSTQVYASLSMGATRMEEEKVVELLYVA